MGHPYFAKGHGLLGPTLGYGSGVHDNLCVFNFKPDGQLSCDTFDACKSMEQPVSLPAEVTSARSFSLSLSLFWYSAVPEKQQVNDSHHLAGGSRR